MKRDALISVLRDHRSQDRQAISGSLILTAYTAPLKVEATNKPC